MEKTNKFASKVTAKKETPTHKDIQTKKHPGGRPKKDPAKKLDVQVFVSVSKTEKKKLEELSEEEGLSISQLCRRALKASKML